MKTVTEYRSNSEAEAALRLFIASNPGYRGYTAEAIDGGDNYRAPVWHVYVSKDGYRHCI